MTPLPLRVITGTVVSTTSKLPVSSCTFPAASVAVNHIVYVHTIPELISCVITTGTLISTLSVALALKTGILCGSVTVFTSITYTFPVEIVMAGASLSIIVIVLAHVDVFPFASVILYRNTLVMLPPVTTFQLLLAGLTITLAVMSPS